MVKIISHRGNLNGPSKTSENHPEQIHYVLEETNFDIEIDVQDFDGSFLVLGHDEPQYHFDLKSIKLKENRDRLWLHCKNVNAFQKVSYDSLWDLHYFFHTSEDVVMTNNGYNWFFPNRYVPIGFKNIVVLPEAFHLDQVKQFDSEFHKWKGFYYGICTDYPELIGNTK